jgi:TonB family protein
MRADLAIVTALMVAAPATDAPTLESLLRQPVSPGVVALTVPHVKDPRVPAMWAAALTDERPPVRATAARVIGVAGAVGLRPALKDAFQKETDDAAALEQAAALAVVSPPAEDDELLAAARPAFAKDVALALARIRGPAVRPHLGRISTLGLGADAARQFFVQATRGGREDTSEMSRAAIGTADPVLIEGLFAASRASAFSVPVGAIETALSSPDPRLTAAACWHLALSTVAGVPMPPALATAAQTAAQRSASSGGDGAAFACDMSSRTLGRKAAAPAPWVEHLGGDAIALPVDLMEDSRILAKLTDAEVASLSMRLTGTPDRLAEVRRGDARRRTAATVGPGRGMRLASGFTPGLLADTLRVAGCAPDGGSFAGGEIVYGADGRPREIRMIDTGLRPACRPAAGALLALSRPAAQRPPDPSSPQVLLLDLSSEAIACADEPAPAGAPRSPGGKIKEPRKVRHVKPVYPPDAEAMHVRGPVIVEAILGQSGCVRSAEVLSAPDGRLAWSALRAVSQWAYSPALLDGTPVPVVMTVTVNYR